MYNQMYKIFYQNKYLSKIYLEGGVTINNSLRSEVKSVMTGYPLYSPLEGIHPNKQRQPTKLQLQTMNKDHLFNKPHVNVVTLSKHNLSKKSC